MRVNKLEEVLFPPVEEHPVYVVMQEPLVSAAFGHRTTAAATGQLDGSGMPAVRDRRSDCRQRSSADAAVFFATPCERVTFDSPDPFAR
jgi:hypothetical protein